MEGSLLDYIFYVAGIMAAITVMLFPAWLLYMAHQTKNKAFFKIAVVYSLIIYFPVVVGTLLWYFMEP